jgi:type III secretion protein D
MPEPIYELRVLAGPQTGASLTLKPGSSVDVGSFTAGGCQVVLRDPLVSEQRVRLHVRHGDVRVEVLAGAIDMAGQRLIAPCILNWPCFVPIKIGDTVLAVGDSVGDNTPGWEQALNLALMPPAQAQPDALPQLARATQPELETQAEPQSQAVATKRRRPEAWLAAGGGFLTLAAVGLLAFVTMTAPAQVATETVPQRVTKVLQAPEFRGLRFESDAHERIAIRGDVLTSADRARLDRQLADARLEAAVQVRVGEEIDAAVRDVYRMNGVAAKTLSPVALSDVGTVRVQTHERDEKKLQQIEIVARRDVTGLTNLQAENTPPQMVPEPTQVIDDPGKRVASIVTGVTPYVVTADGTRYFVGALLPSGHRLASISDQQVMLDKDGKLTPLKF